MFLDETEQPQIHDRMPVVLRPEERAAWLGDNADLVRIFNRRDIPLTHKPA